MRTKECNAKCGLASPASLAQIERHERMEEAQLRIMLAKARIEELSAQRLQVALDREIADAQEASYDAELAAATPFFDDEEDEDDAAANVEAAAQPGSGCADASCNGRVPDEVIISLAVEDGTPTGCVVKEYRVDLNRGPYLRAALLDDPDRPDPNNTLIFHVRRA